MDAFFILSAHDGTPLIEKHCHGNSAQVSQTARQAVALVFDQAARTGRLRTVPVAADALAAVVSSNTINLNNINVGQLASTASAAAVSAAASTTAAAASALNSLSNAIPSLSNLASSIPTVQQPATPAGAFYIGGDGGVIVNETNVFDVIPLASTDEFYLVHIQRNSLFFVALFREEVQPLEIIEFLQRIVDILIDYFGEISEIIIKEHFVVVYELLEEMLDNGHPYITETAILKDMVPPPSLLSSMMNAVALGPNTFGPSKLPSGSFSVPWRTTGIKYAKNEFYMDIIESLNVLLDKNGKILSGNISGEVRCTSKLSGMPDLTLNFQNPKIFEDVMTAFHPCVRYFRFDKERIISFVPPDGDFKLMDYVLPITNPQYLPIVVKPQIYFTKAGGSLQVSLKALSTGGKPLEQVIVTIVLPPSISSAKIDASVGSVQYDQNARKMRWIVPKISPEAPSPSLTGQLYTSSTGTNGDVNGNEGAIVEEVLGTYTPKTNGKKSGSKQHLTVYNSEKSQGQEVNGAYNSASNGGVQKQQVLAVSPLVDVTVEFKVAMHTASGLKIDQLNVHGEAYAPFKKWATRVHDLFFVIKENMSPRRAKANAIEESSSSASTAAPTPRKRSSLQNKQQKIADEGNGDAEANEDEPMEGDNNEVETKLRRGRSSLSSVSSKATTKAKAKAKGKGKVKVIDNVSEDENDSKNYERSRSISPNPNSSGNDESAGANSTPNVNLKKPKGKAPPPPPLIKDKIALVLTPALPAPLPLAKEEMLMLIAADDIPFEEECIRTPQFLKAWLFYLDHKATAPLAARSFIFERALAALPGSYKLWKAYIDLRLASILNIKSTNPATGLSKRLKQIHDPDYEAMNSIFERALILCNKHPVIWLTYCRFLMHQPCPTRTRRAFDRALKALPITQHPRVWDLYLKFAAQCSGETAVRIWRRFLKLQGLDAAEEYVNLLLIGLDHDNENEDEDGEKNDDEDEENIKDIKELKKAPRYAEAARVLSIIMADPKYVSPKGQTSFQIWNQFCELVCQHADAMKIPTSDALFGTVADSSARADGGVAVNGKGLGLVEVLNVDKMIRAGLEKFSDEVGRLWNSLARWNVALGKFETARDIYEEAIVKVSTVRDFTMIFDAYAEFEETVITARMEEIAELDEKDDVSLEDKAELETDVDMRLARLEKLMERRPFLVNDVLLRQNPHNVNEWEQRAHLHRERGNLEKVIETYSEAIKTIIPKKSSGKLHLLWTRFATFYEDNDDLEQARLVFERAVNVAYKHVDDLAELWCQWAEMELRHKEFNRALDVMGRATVSPPLSKKIPSLALIRYNDEELSPQVRVFKSLKLWSFYVDLEESIGTVESTKLVYERIMELKIATPQIIINCANFLEEQKWFEESYKAYEKGIELFGYPIAFELWNLYLQKFVARHGAEKLERARDLFEHALDKCPAKFAKTLYLLYAKLEEDHGLTRHAMKIYDRATRAVGDADRFQVFEYYIAKSVSFFGRTSAREIYTRAIEVLPDKSARTMAMRFAQLEASLFEIDRARAVWGYGSQFADPRIDAEYWKHWQEFETKHGNEDTFKEMLRLKRSVQAKFNTDIGFISTQLLAQRAAAAGLTTKPIEENSGDVIANLEAQTKRLNEELDEEDRKAGRVAPEKKQPSGSRIVGFVPAKDRSTLSEVTDGVNASKDDPEAVVGTTVANPDAIEIGDSDDDEGANTGNDANGAMELDLDVDAESEQDVDEEGKKEFANLQKRVIPDAVFGGLAKLGNAAEDKKKDLGAKERFKRKR
ncbi:pre-mRNA-splicing factor syf1 [Physocladia obscura]|uniref:Pre-mRNA-splicing factor SYF1 n=1 Tax=Physocladia obscura TaxID=109957 RepID=A0AAD5T6S1_9FUNG|nr:pre-mRNA-splicing factor syf1 [Physocladia obscura]